MGYKHKLVPIFSEKQVGTKIHNLTEFSKIELAELSRKICKKNAPSALAFASCFSYFSQVKDVLIANGVMAGLNLTKDLGEVSAGKAYRLDSQQAEIINTMREVGIQHQQIFVSQ